ncbi:MAG: hypothetical protein ACRBDL_02415 [Alphaproteobacteria bacterium]
MSFILKPFYILAIFAFCGTALCALPSDSFAQEEILDIIDRHKNKKKTMQTRTLKPSSTPKNDGQTESSDTSPNQEEKPEKELTEDERTWKKYRDLADGKKPKKSSVDTSPKKSDKQEDTSTVKERKEDAPSETEDTLASKTDDQKQDEEKEEQQPEEQGETLMNIVKEYTESNKKHGTMNSRSYGDID